MNIFPTVCSGACSMWLINSVCRPDYWPHSFPLPSLKIYYIGDVYPTTPDVHRAVHCTPRHAYTTLLYLMQCYIIYSPSCSLGIHCTHRPTLHAILYLHAVHIIHTGIHIQYILHYYYVYTSCNIISSCSDKACAREVKPSLWLHGLSMNYLLLLSISGLCIYNVLNCSSICPYVYINHDLFFPPSHSPLSLSHTPSPSYSPPSPSLSLGPSLPLPPTYSPFSPSLYFRDPSR